MKRFVTGQARGQATLFPERLDLFSAAIVAIDGSKFKAVNNRDKNFTPEQMTRREQELESSIARYLAQLDSADAQEPAVAEAKSERLQEKIAALKEQMRSLKVLEAAQERLDRTPETMRLRRQTVEHPFGTIKLWMGYTHFLNRTLPRVQTEMSLHVLAYNAQRRLGDPSASQGTWRGVSTRSGPISAVGPAPHSRVGRLDTADPVKAIAMSVVRRERLLATSRR